MTAEQLAAERKFWASVKASEDPADIRTYLEQFPGGMFEALARNWLKRLEKAAQPQAAQVTTAPAVPTQAAAPAPSSSPESVEEALGLTRAQRILVQRGLMALGFDVGAVDGILAPMPSHTHCRAPGREHGFATRARRCAGSEVPVLPHRLRLVDRPTDPHCHRRLAFP